MKDGEDCPKCGERLYEGVRYGYIVCLRCRFESKIEGYWDDEDEMDIDD